MSYTPFFHFADSDIFEIFARHGAKYRVQAGANADMTCSLSTADIVRVGVGTLTGSHNYTVDSVEADEGVTFLISRTEDTSANNVVVKDGPSGFTLITLTNTSPSWCVLAYSGFSNSWHVLLKG